MYWVTLLVPNLSYRRGLVSLRRVFPIIEISSGVVLIVRFICFGINTIFDFKVVCVAIAARAIHSKKEVIMYTVKKLVPNIGDSYYRGDGWYINTSRGIILVDDAKELKEELDGLD